MGVAFLRRKDRGRERWEREVKGREGEKEEERREKRRRERPMSQ